MSKKYIGVDLGAWYGKKTSIAILEKTKDSLTLEKIIREFSTDNKIECIYHKEENKKKIITNENWRSSITPEEKNEKLVKYLLEQKGTDNTIIGIDAPFAIPYYLANPLANRDMTEKLYNPNPDNKTGELMNQFIYDNSARFIYEKTKERVLAPAGDKIGKMTARMVHIASHYKNELNIVKSPHLDIQNKDITTIEVYPRATLKILLTGKIPSYKNDNWESEKENREKMIGLLEEHIENINEWKEEINTDDDYDAIICALTCYLIDKNGYEKPEDEDLDKFTNSFIYIPKVEK